MTAKVLMMVANDIHHDTRVYKSALALADGGVDVTVLGYTPGQHREETFFGPVRIIRVPVPFRLRERARQRKSRTVVPPVPNAREQRVARLQVELRRREAAEFRELALRARAQWSRGKIIGQGAMWRVQRGLGRRERLVREAGANWWGGRTSLASWRRQLPEIDDFDTAYAPVIDSLDWQILHAHDVHHVGTAARAVARRRQQGRPAAWVYDAHEYVAGLPIFPPRTKRFIAAYTKLEAEYVRRADAVITVTPALADQLRDQYGLKATPTVVMNAPQLETKVELTSDDVRTACGVDDSTPLVVYSGGVTPARGVATVIQALKLLPGVHFAVVCVPSTRTQHALMLRREAGECGVADRVHLVEPVAPAQVSEFLATADAGVHPLLHFGGHEFALPNKLFEYLHAGLPLAVSDCRALSEFVSDNAVGTVFTAQDPESCARALRELLGSRDLLRARIVQDRDLLTPYGWERQAVVLRDLYRDLMRDRAAVAEPARGTALQDVSERPAWRDQAPSVLAIGPANMAGQAWQWAKALERESPGVNTEVVTIDRGQVLMFESDQLVQSSTYRNDEQWSADLRGHALKTWTHALLESGMPIFGTRGGRRFEDDVTLLRGRGVRVGLVLHGSEIRDPAVHAMSAPWSPFTDPADPFTERLQNQVNRLAPRIRQFARGGGPVFVSTPDLLQWVPNSIWLPVVVDVQRWQAPEPALERETPVVLHAPSQAALKGSAVADEIVARLEKEGLVEYRRLQDMAPEQMPEVIAGADIVLDQFALGIYGVLPCEAMAAQRLVISHVLPQTRQHVRAVTGRDLPILEANPDTLEQTLRDVLVNRGPARELARSGAEFVTAVHNGRYSAQVLRERFNVRSSSDIDATQLAADAACAASAAQLRAAEATQTEPNARSA
ncbi:glycosyltransferase family 4 protein [Piscicoccus intestinalis]|uniref:glycosyltransferase family 4 protein n=1 Tax=Piscicoccus intestinalis TaxID=746033 RepID=UPI0009FFC2C9|nr:glycosyltransferase family 4 protein [Piscicoccus intestinalis]